MSGEGKTIPEDIRDTSKRIAELSWLTRHERDLLAGAIAEAIHDAVMAERERCVFIAETIRRQNDQGHGFDSQSARTTAWEIRELISQGAVAAPKAEG